MTQTITNCNEIPAGKTYPVGDLRTAESIEQLCEYVDAGHPIADKEGREAKSFCRQSQQAFLWLCFNEDIGFLDTNGAYDYRILELIKLAPLAYRNGRPLHVGDEIAIKNAQPFEKNQWVKKIVLLTKTTLASNWLYWVSESEWRFADEACAV
jgi:hypothetical protein